MTHLDEEPPSLAELAQRVSTPSREALDPTRFEGGGYRDAPQRIERSAPWPLGPWRGPGDVAAILQSTPPHPPSATTGLLIAISGLAAAILLVVAGLVAVGLERPHLDRDRCVEVRR